ncbi:MAG: LamG domain-containing protein [Candidatus Poribacteria bacterium]|nr:LamG domain-containing protein [Candidatus Poribacteria bacterium]
MKNITLTYKFSLYGIMCLFIAVSMLFTLSVSANLTDGLILHHTYDEGQGTLAADASGNGHDGEITNPDWDSGKFGGALRFGGEGSDAYVTVESTDALNVNECSFMAWINADHWDGTRQIVGKSVHGGCAGRTQYGLFSEGGVFKLRFETDGGRADITTDLPATEEWVNVAFTNDGETAMIYINAEAVVDGEVPGALNANDDPWRIGQDCERLNYVFAGLIDEVRLWNRALSADEIGGAQGLLTPVDPLAKLTTTWGNIKTNR